MRLHERKKVPPIRDYWESRCRFNIGCSFWNNTIPSFFFLSTSLFFDWSFLWNWHSRVFLSMAALSPCLFLSPPFSLPRSVIICEKSSMGNFHEYASVVRRSVRRHNLRADYAQHWEQPTSDNAHISRDDIDRRRREKETFNLARRSNVSRELLPAFSC